MKRLVVDASVVAAAFFPEKHTETARTLLFSDGALHAPDLIYAEIANVVWKRRRHGEIDDEEAAGLLADMLDLPLEIRHRSNSFMWLLSWRCGRAGPCTIVCTWRWPCKERP